MNEVEKMYENAGIVPKKNCYYWDCPYSTGNIGEDDKKEKDCENCNNPDKKVYPLFTAEKQITILCWLVNLTGDVEFNNKPTDITPEGLQEALAWAVNRCWAKLTPEQQQQIKEILK